MVELPTRRPAVEHGNEAEHRRELAIAAGQALDAAAANEASIDSLETSKQDDLLTILTANGDLLTRAAGVIARLAAGSDGQRLQVSSSAPAYADNIVVGTVQATTSGSSKTFSGIPSWAKRITVFLDQVSLSGTDLIWLRLGDSGGIETTGYESTAATVVNAGATGANEETSAFVVSRQGVASQDVTQVITLYLIDPANNLWLMQNVGRVDAGGTAAVQSGGGRKALSDTLTQLQILTSGSDTFDAGQVNIHYE